MWRWILLFSLFLPELEGCGKREDSCLAAKQVRSASPSGQRIAEAYPGGCPDVDLPPQVTVEFVGRAGDGVLELRQAVPRIDLRWVGEDTLEIRYPADAIVEEQDSVARFEEERVSIIYGPVAR